MKRIITIACCFLGLMFGLSIQAQNDAKAIAVLQKAAQAYEKAGGVEASFDLSILDPQQAEHERIQGHIYMKADKFKIEVDDMITWFDGRNQWVYLKGPQEVNLSEPDADEQLMINPIKIFLLYKHGYTSKNLGNQTFMGKSSAGVQLLPQDKYSSLKEIRAYFHPNTGQALGLELINKDDSKSIISIKSYQTGKNFLDAFFVFQQKLFPNTQVIDLR